MAKRIGKRTIILENCPAVIGYGSVVGKNEKEGPIGDEFDCFDYDCRFGEKSFEKAESRMQKIAFQTALKRAGKNEKDTDLIFAGDLLNQCIGSSFGIRNTEIPLIGIYGACSTMVLGLSLAAISVDCGAAQIAAAVTSSHFCSAERQYRFPLEYGCQRTPTAQRTVTGAGATILGKADKMPFIEKITFGKIVDLGVKDANNMGAAMAPSACDTVASFLSDTKTNPNDYDAIFTGDLGTVGTKLFKELIKNEGFDLDKKHIDCGNLIYNKNRQDIHSGGSGCGCSAAVLNSYVVKRLINKRFKNILFVSTGALLSPTSTLQGESIPGISHLVSIKCGD